MRSATRTPLPMQNETRVERWLDRALARAQTPRGGATLIAAITTIVTVGAGLLMTAVDHKNFTSLGLGLWWAVQTVSTVGYGDVVPTSTAGRLVAAAVMLLGLAFLSVITAAITSTFVARATEARTRRAGRAAPATANDVRVVRASLRVTRRSNVACARRRSLTLGQRRSFCAGCKGPARTTHRVWTSTACRRHSWSVCTQGW